MADLFPSFFWSHTAIAAGKIADSVPLNDCLNAGGILLPPSRYLMLSLSDTAYASQSLESWPAPAMAISFISLSAGDLVILAIRPLSPAWIRPTFSTHVLI